MNEVPVYRCAERFERGQLFGYAQVSEADYHGLLPYVWLTGSSESAVLTAPYRCAEVGIKLVRVYMHRQILGLGPWKQDKRAVIFLDDDRMDLRRENLRIASRRQLAAHQRLRRDNASGFKGVGRSGLRWKARISGNWLGTFPAVVEAAVAYNTAATALFGEYARLNDVPANRRADVDLNTAIDARTVTRLQRNGLLPTAPGGPVEQPSSGGR